MPSPSSLSSEQKRIAKYKLKEILPDNPPRWIEVGQDTRKLWVAKLVEILRNTQNSEIADAISKDTNLGHELIREKIKTLKKPKKRPSKTEQQAVDSSPEQPTTEE